MLNTHFPHKYFNFSRLFLHCLEEYHLSKSQQQTENKLRIPPISLSLFSRCPASQYQAWSLVFHIGCQAFNSSFIPYGPKGQQPLGAINIEIHQHLISSYIFIFNQDGSSDCKSYAGPWDPLVHSKFCGRPTKGSELGRNERVINKHNIQVLLLITGQSRSLACRKLALLFQQLVFWVT